MSEGQLNIDYDVDILPPMPLLLGIFGYCSEEIDLAALPGSKCLGPEGEQLAALLDGFREVFDENREEYLD